MTYGLGPYGTAPYGGISFDPAGPSLVSSVPVNNSFDIAVNASVSFVLTSPATLDPYSLNVILDGAPAIVASTFLTGYSGSIVFDGFTCTVSIDTHPNFGITIPVAITITDLALITATINLTFYTALADPLNMSEGVTLATQHSVGLTDTIIIADSVLMGESLSISAVEVLNLTEDSSIGSIFIRNLDATTLQILFNQEFRVNHIIDTLRYRFESLDGGVPLTVYEVTPIYTTIQQGISGTTGTVSSDPRISYELVLDGTFSSGNVGDYVTLSGPTRSWNQGLFRIEAVLASNKVKVDKPVFVDDPTNGSFSWSHTNAVKEVHLQVNKATNGKWYGAHVGPFDLKLGGGSVAPSGEFRANTPRPRVGLVSSLSEGEVLVSFDNVMRVDSELVDPSEYVISGPTQVSIVAVRLFDPSSIILHTSGLGSGSYSLTVNATGTPKDIAGNPVDPVFNQAIFTANTPLLSRSVFTDHGPLAKPPVTLQSGTGATIQTYVTTTFGPSNPFTSDEVIFPGAAFTSDVVGLYIELSGTSVNAGTYKVLALVGITGARLRLQASFRLPDPNNGSLSWRLIDYRNGQIADDPADVTVRVNGVAQTAQAVVGLLGQIVLASAPSETDEVHVDYSWICDPVVDFRRLNSREFNLNTWRNDNGKGSNPSQHTYRYRTTLIQPGVYVPGDMQAQQDQPLLRELHYRAYERAYTSLLNDPNLLVLNVPTHRVAYPPLSRTIAPTLVSYTGDTLPENDPDSPWVRYGVGVASAGNGNLAIQDNTTGPFPTGNPLFWVHAVDLTYPHIFAVTWRTTISSVSVLDGIFTGVSVGWSDGERALVLGYLDQGGVKQVGFLKKGQGNDPSFGSSWSGGLFNNTSTGQPANFDWSTLHSYRLFQDRDGVVRLFVDGEIAETLRINESELPYLEELNDPFNQIQGVFFGSLSRPAESDSVWDFFRYLALPTNPEQTEPSIFVSYEGDVDPEDEPFPWTPVGYHGNETITNGVLILDSTSATDSSTFPQVGYIGGDFRGFTRIEPLLQVSSDVVLDVGVQLRTLTHGITPNAVMAAVDDGYLLTQLCFFPTEPQPKVSYPGRSFPEQASPKPWGAIGGASVAMLGRTLRVTDSLANDGKVYFIEDLEPVGSAQRILASTIDSYVEAKFLVVTYTPDGTSVSFCGATIDVFDGTRAMGLLLRQVSGTRYVALHSDGLLLSNAAQWAFDWGDGKPHVYRLVKSVSGNLVSVFVDGVLLGSFAYSSFAVGSGNPTLSFGSSTAASSGSSSVVDWYYVNAWRAQSASSKRYIGIWRGSSTGTLSDFHLPLYREGVGSVAGNVLTDGSVDLTTLGINVGGQLVVDQGVNAGVYTIASVSSAAITIASVFPVTTGEVRYRIPKTVDWTASHKYRVVRDPGGSVSLFMDQVATPILRVDYNEVSLPSSILGVPNIINRGLPSITWGAFDPTNLSQVGWDFVRYGITQTPSGHNRIPPHQVLNQRNVIASPEHITTNIPHNHTQFSSASTGIPYPWDTLISNPSLGAYTKLNEGTPLVPSTQTFEVRRPTPVFTTLYGLNDPKDILNDQGFLLNDGSTKVTLLVPDDILYNSLVVDETSTGEPDLLAPFSDECQPYSLGRLSWQKEICLEYAGDVLPEQDQNAATPWVLVSDNPGQVTATAFSGILTYTVGAGMSVYRNQTPIVDPVGLDTQVSFRIKLLMDASGGVGDTGVRFGFSAFNFTAALAFITTPQGDREVRLLDLNQDEVLAALPFDFSDGNFHVYRLVKNVAEGTLDFFIDS